MEIEPSMYFEIVVAWPIYKNNYCVLQIIIVIPLITEVGMEDSGGA